MNSGLRAALASGVLLLGGTGYHLQGGRGCRAPWGVSARCQSPPPAPVLIPHLPEEEQQLRAGGDSWKGTAAGAALRATMGEAGGGREEAVGWEAEQEGPAVHPASCLACLSQGV